MNSENNQGLLKQRLDDHTARMKEHHENNLYKNAVFRSFDVIALECMRVGIEDWQKMVLEDIRKAVEVKHKELQQKENHGSARKETAP